MSTRLRPLLFGGLAIALALLIAIMGMTALAFARQDAAAIVPARPEVYVCGTLPRGVMKTKAETGMAAGSSLSYNQDPPILTPGYTGAVALRDFTVVGDYAAIRIYYYSPALGPILVTLYQPFTDDSLTAGASVIRAVHITELRARIDAQRLRVGLPAFSWSDADLSGVVAKAAHVVELRSVLQAVYSAAGRTPPSFTDPALTAGQTGSGRCTSPNYARPSSPWNRRLNHCPGSILITAPNVSSVIA